MRFSTAIAAGAAATIVSADAYLGFNSGSLKADNSVKQLSDFEAEFKTAQNLENSPGKFNSVRLYTNIQGGTKSDPISAFEAAINTKTNLLLGIWTSGTPSIENEINALKAGLDKYGQKLADLIIGMSIGSEDLYRNSVTGVTNKAGIGADPDVIVGFIKTFKSAFSSSLIKNVPIGHVDTWDVWGNGTNKAVIDAVDWIGVDEYPYYQNATSNSIKNSGKLFDEAFAAAAAAAQGKPVWLTETGWPYVGDKWDEAEPSVENAKYYWNEVGCRALFGKVNTFWYNLRDSNSANSMKFAITDNLSTKPRFDLSCPTTFDTPTSGSGSSSSSSASGTATGTASLSPSASGTASSGGSSATGGASGTGSAGSAGSSGAAGSGSTAKPSSTSSPGTSAASLHGVSAVAAVVALIAAFAL